MTSTLYEPSRANAKPFDGNRRLLNVVSLQYRINHLKSDADARQLQLRPGDEVIVDTDRGPVIARVCSHVSRKIVDVAEFPRVLRKANDGDLSQAQRNEEIQEAAYRFALERIRARKLKMKLIRTQCMQDGSKIVFFFSADGRIDFRDLVKDLAHRFRTRIEMFQIGVRDGARMLGGIGPCGRELCCSTFLDHFEPISIRMAKDQALTLNPNKISGMCGRLMCCLVYEQKVYRRMRRRLPRAGSPVLTDSGEATISSVDIVNQQVTVSYEDAPRRILALDEIQLLDSKRVNQTVDAKGDDKKILDGESGSDRSRRKRRNKTAADSADES